jgi:hypothetical protein
MNLRVTLKIALTGVMLMGATIVLGQSVPPNVDDGNSIIVAPPTGARYTIYCLSVTGSDHTLRANEIKRLWAAATHRQDWYVLHQDDQSLIYFGYYRAASDPKDSDSARIVADRKMIQALTDSMGDHPFEQALVMPLDAPDPSAPPEWNLLNTKGVWSLEIAVYKGPDRKMAAVDSVRAARQQGVEAYYYHGPSASSVCIGNWPQDAVHQDMNGNVQGNDPNQTIVVVPDELAPHMAPAMIADDGSPAPVLHNNATIVDPTLTAAMQKYPYNHLNGLVDLVHYNGKMVPRQSAVVAIPHSTQTADSLQNATDRPKVDLLGGGDSGTSAGTSGGSTPAGGPTGGQLPSLGN